jgi:hypothetical protein
MSADRDAFDLECQLRLIEHIETHSPTAEPLDLWVEGFWAGVRASAKPRSAEELQLAIDMRRARAAGLTK